MAASIKEALQSAIAQLSEAECLQVMEFIQDSLKRSLDQENQTNYPESSYVSDEELFEYVDGILVVKAVLADSVKPEDIEFVVKRDRGARARQLMSW